jgi:hypothetical protein
MRFHPVPKRKAESTHWMNDRVCFFIFLALLITLGACNHVDTKTQILSKCTILADESRQYGGANYVRLFYSINPNKFATTYQKAIGFDNKAHRTVINTYIAAVEGIKTKDAKALELIKATLEIARFVQHFVDYNYAIASKLKQSSKYNPKSDAFFIEINNIIKFDSNIVSFNKNQATFTGLLKTYNKALGSFNL